MADEVFQAMLSANASLGIHPGHGAAGSVSVGRSDNNFPFDLSGEGEGHESVARELLGEHGWHLSRMLGPADTKQVKFQYHLEQIGAPLTTPSLRNAVVQYHGVPKNQKVVFAYRRPFDQPYLVSPEETGASLRHYALRSMTSVDLGASLNEQHYRLLKTGLNIESLLTIMWLIHLDVLGGNDIRVDVRPSVRALIPPNTLLEQERDYTKSLSGVRVHINSVDAFAKALLVAACDRTQLMGASARLTRFQWASTDLTLYGGLMPTAQQVLLANSDAIARAILNFADQYGARSTCGKALRTACLLYGQTIYASKVVLRFGYPNVHEDTHAVEEVPYGLNRCKELASPELLALSMFVGHAHQQSAGQTMRSAILGTKGRDVPDAERVVSKLKPKLVQQAGKMLDSWWQGRFSTYIVEEEYLRLSSPALMDCRGVLHCLSMGIVLTETVLETVTSPIELNTISDASVVDDPHLAKQHADEASRWYIVSDLISTGGENLCHSTKAIPRVIGADVGLHPEIRSFAQTRIQFVLAGVASPVRLRINQARDVEHSTKRSSVEYQPHVDTLQHRLSEQQKAMPRPLSGDTSWVDGLLDARGPVATTTMKRTRPSVRDLPPERTTDLVVVERRNDDEGSTTVEEAAQKGWGPEPTSGDGLLCGARALHQSLTNIAVATGDDKPLFDNVLRAVREALTPEQQNIADLAQVAIGPRDFTVDQLGAGLRRLGDYRLGVVTTIDGRGSLQIHGPDTGRIVLVAHDGRAHWSSIGPNTHQQLWMG